MRVLDVKPMIGSRERPWFQVFWLDVERSAMSKWLGTEPYVAWVDGLGDADYWAIEFDCGLKISFEFLHHGEQGSVLATEPVPQHAGRHLSRWRTELSEQPPELFERDRDSMIESFAKEMPELSECDHFQLWRQGDDGNQVKVGIPTSRQDAECWSRELESHKHKQVYWVSRVDS